MPKKTILLEECYKDGVYLGRKEMEVDDMTPAFIRKIKQDTEDRMGHRKYWGIYDNEMRKKWRAIKVE